MNNKQQLINIITNNTSKKLINIEINKEIEKQTYSAIALF